MANKFNIGFIKRRDNDEYIASCGCGAVKMLGNWRKYNGLSEVKCEGCGNTTFAKLDSEKRTIYPYIEVLQKDRKGFKLKRTNLSVFHDDDYNVYVKENMIQVLKYDLVNKVIKLYKNGEDVEISYYHPERTIGRFFSSIEDHKTRRLISTPETGTLYDFAWDKLSYKKNNSYGERKIWRGLVELMNGYTYMQILSNAGYTNITRFYERNGGYYNNNTINKSGTTPKDILGLPKFALKYIRENDNSSVFDIKQMKSALQKVETNRFKELMEIASDESTISELCRTLDTLVEIHDKYHYNNLRKLTLYLFREVRMNQGIDRPSEGATLLRDYISMATKLEQEYDKYPKSLKKEHDITMMNYNVQKNEMKKRDFEKAVNDEAYKELEYKKKNFVIITPKEMHDLIKEGSELSHCIASYVNSVIEKKCQILFLRDIEEIHKPLVSIEVRGGNVRQVRGFANRSARKEEKEFITEWATKKGLQEAYY